MVNPERKGAAAQIPDRGWDTITGLVAPDPAQRKRSLKDLPHLPEYPGEPLLVYLLATRITDQDLAIRFEAVKELGSLLSGESQTGKLGETALGYLAGFLADLKESQYVDLLEVSAVYLAAEEPVGRILAMCSFAGEPLSGIVNDRKLPLQIRQQAVFFCGEIGFLSTIPALRILVQRVERDQERPASQRSRKTNQEGEVLYLAARAALSKLVDDPDSGN